MVVGCKVGCTVGCTVECEVDGYTVECEVGWLLYSTNNLDVKLDAM